ncbi:HlyD family secretion protein [Synechococcus sp. GEYO]|uniref:HlyD family secretion protein n=1 Tax=Synechococcus sp. GEYO TaxID=2575511 RepID=UPI000E0E0E26|nr:HlyD family efflux transporter periplasmic adaptor subunit [Synechococcus sp. GEYO]
MKDSQPSSRTKGELNAKPPKDSHPSEETPSNQSESIKDKAGNAANDWLARNRNLVLRQTPVWAQSLAGLLVGLGSLALIGGFVFRIDEVVTVQGQLKSIGGTVEVKTPAGGRVAEVLFNDGEAVEAGQLLMKFDTRQAADEKILLTRLIIVEEKELVSKLESIKIQKETTQGRLDVLNQKLNTKRIITKELQSLVNQGGFQRISLLEQLDEMYTIRKQITETKQQLNQLDLQAAQYRLDTQKSINQMKTQLKKAQLQLQYQNVTSPVAGIVFDPQVRVEGVLQAGERILSIVPQKGLYAEVFVPNQDIGFVKTGQKAKVRVDAFPFSRYGELNGVVSQIGADALPPDTNMNFYRFPVKLELNRSFLENKNVQIPLQAGMTVTSNMKLREKRVIGLISDLLVDQTDSVRSIRQQ